MTDLIKFIRLDYITFKPYIKIKYLAVFIFLVLYMAIMSNNIYSGVYTGMMVATIFVPYPFLISEKNNLEALYITLAVNRRSVVKGRYIFIFIINICAILFSSIFAAVGIILTRLLNFSSNESSGGYFIFALILPVMFIFVQAVQIPLFFKLGYTKAKILSLIPFVAMFTVYIIVISIQNVSIQVTEFLLNIYANGVLVPTLIAVFVLIIFISYSLSREFYGKREF